LNWFEHGDLIITVLGENTSLAKYIPKTQAAASPKANIATSTAVAVKVDPKAQKEFDSATKQNDKLRGELKKKKGLLMLDLFDCNFKTKKRFNYD